jgi:uroporphyrin-III C-methyltransferase
MNNTKNKARVSLVGAGPGDKDLITIAGLRAIQSADVILYDALVNVALLQEATPDAKKIFVGKRAGTRYNTQDEINLLIVQSALNYGHAVRLKGGDPFIFGRGHEELEYIKAFNISTQIIPGISSSISIPLLQEVPLTRRDISQSFWVLTGTTKEEKLSKDIEIAAKTDATLVILMGIKKLKLIQKILLEEGKADLPIMIVQSGSTSAEKKIVTTIKEVVYQAEKHEIGTPGIIVIGEVVRLHPEFVQQKIASTWNL